MADNLNSKYSWIIPGVIVPLLIAVFIPLLTPLVTNLAHAGKELSYSISDPIVDLNEELTAGQPITVGGQEMKSLVAYQVRIRNSGGSSLQDVAVRIDFQPQNTNNFQVISVTHHTTPAEEFGAVTEEKSTFSRRYVYGLLNPNDADQMTFLLSSRAAISVYAKSDGMKLDEEAQSKSSGYPAWFVPLIALIIAVLQIGLLEVMRRRRDTVSKSLKP